MPVSRMVRTASRLPGAPKVEDIFAEISHDRLAAARQVLAYLGKNPQPHDFVNAARRLVFLKGTNSHDYKFSSAVLEDYQHLSAEWRERFLANWDRLEGSFDETFKRMWEFYLAYCEAGFRAGYLGVSQLGLARTPRF